MAGKVSSNPNEFLLPDLGEGLESADLIEWCVSVGQTVKEQDVLAKMETAKAVVDLYSPRGGKIAQLHGKAGDTIKVGAPIVTFEGPGGGGGGENGKQQQLATRAEPDRASMKATEEQVKGDDETADREDAGTVVGSLGGADYSAVEGKVRAAPAVRRLARDLGVNLEQVRGTGIGGRVTMRDVETAKSSAQTQDRPGRFSGRSDAPAARPSAPQRTAPTSPQPARQSFTVPTGHDQVRTPFKGVRRVIADRLSQSVHTAVHFTVMDEADITELDVLRRRLIAATGEKLSYLPFVAVAVSKALREPEYARMNSTVDDQKQEIVTHRSVHLGIATDTDNGLMVPVIRDADQMGVIELGRHIADRAARARDRTIAKEDLYGSTFTISNVGSLAGRFATPIINYPEVGILAVGRARDGVVVRQQMLGVGKLLPLSMSCDHRVVDGGMAALLLARVIELLQKPDSLIPPA